MTKKNEEWYHVQPTKETSVKPQVNANIHTTCFSLQELEEILLTSNVPMAKAAYAVKDRSGQVAFEGTYCSADQETYEYALKEILPLGEWKSYETKDGAFLLEMEIELCSGQVISGYAAFKCVLHGGTTSTEVPEKDLLERLAAIPIAKPGMSTDELRKICLDFMRLQSQFPYKLNHEYAYVIESQKRLRILRPGIVHGGLPYVTKGAGNLYRVAEYYDPATGMIDTAADIFRDPRVFGNACSGNACISWLRAVTSTKSGYTPCMTKANGYLPVGPYQYSRDVKAFVRASVDPDGYDCKDICRENGEQVMFESYAAMEPADGVGCNGHVRMNAVKPVVVRLTDGSIDGDQSFCLMVEQVCYTIHPNHLRIHPDGSHYTAQGCVDIKYTFKELFDTNYIPFTFAELIGEKEVELAKVELSCGSEKSALTVEELKETTLFANYPISDVFVSVRDGAGAEIYRYIYRAEDFFIKEVSFGEILPWEQMKGFGGNALVITSRLYNGELLEVFNGTLLG